MRMAGRLNMKITLKRIYDKPSDEDGFRILVDRIWPRGVSKQDAHIDKWLKDIAPSTELRKWFAHDPDKWPEFKKRYFNQLKEHAELVNVISQIAQKQPVTLVYAAKDEEYNNAVALIEYFKKHIQ